MTDLFREKAKDWDKNEQAATLSSAVGASIIEQIPLNDQMLAMDFGAGTGLICAQIAAHVKSIVAVDTSRAMLEKLASKSEFNTKVKIRCQDILEQPLEENFDIIVSAMAMHHVKDTSKLILQFSEHLNPGGWIALADLDKEDGSFHSKDMEGIFHHGFERDYLQNLLEQYGFSKINFVTAHTIDKEGKDFPVFLVVAVKSESQES